MAMNMDAVLRIAAKVQGLNDFKALSDQLLNVNKASTDSQAGFQRLSSESSRLAQESVRAANSAKIQSASLRELGASARTNATEIRRSSGEAQSFGAVLQRLRSQSTGVVDGIVKSAFNAASGINTLSASFTPVNNQIDASKVNVDQFSDSLQQLSGQSASALSGIGKSAINAANGIHELQVSLDPTDQQIALVRQELIEFEASSKKTERSIAQQIQVFKNLRSQAELNGEIYKQLTADVDRLRATTSAIDAAGSKGAQGIEKVTTASKSSSAALKDQIKTLERLRRKLTESSEGYKVISREIDNLKAKSAALDLPKFTAPGAAAAASGTVGAIRQLVDMRRELSKTNAGRVVLAGEGTAIAGLTGTIGAAGAAGIGGAAGGLSGIASQLDVIASKASALPGVLKPLGGLLATPAAAAGDAIANWGASLAAAQSKLAALSGPFEAIGTAIQSIGPETTLAAGAASLAIASVYDVLKRRADEAQRDLEESFKGISDDVQRTLQQLARVFDAVPAARLAAQRELRDRNLARLGEAQPGSIEARRAANAVVSAEREITKIQGEQNKLLDAARARESEKLKLQKEQRDAVTQRLNLQKRLTQETIKEREELRQSNAIVKSIRRNQERTAPERQRQAELAETIKQQRDIARSRLDIQRKLTEEARNERNELRQSNAIAGSIRRNQERQERAAAAQERIRRNAAAAFPRSTMLALPAAGQTTAPGTGQAISGGARLSLSNIETAGTRDVIGTAMSSLPKALEQANAAATKTKGALRDVFIEITKAEQASNGSINSLQRQRAAWQALQNAVNPAAPAYENARRNVERLDNQLQRLTKTQQKAAVAQQPRGGIGAAGSALGSLALGGGLQGALGAAAGELMFSGGAAKFAAGAGIAAVAAVGALAATVGIEAENAEVRLKALTDQFGEYTQAQAAAARIAKTLRVSQTESADSFSQLYAALRPTGVTIKEIEDAFIGFTAAARVSGATAQESAAAILQLKQALGSGVLQGDELRSIREQAPLVAQAIAKEMNVSVGELKKLGEQGKITTDIVLRALAALKNQSLDKLNKQLNTSGQALQDLSNATNDFGRTIARVFGPTSVAIVRGLGNAIREVNAVMGALTGGNGAMGRIEDMQRARAQAERDTNARQFGWFDFQGREQFFRQRTQQLFRQYQEERAAAAERSAPPPTAAQEAERQRAARAREQARQSANADKQNKDKRDAEKTQSRMNELLSDNLRLNTELGNIGKDRLSQIRAEHELIPQLLKLELADLNATLKGDELRQARINTILEARTRALQLEQEFKDVTNEINNLLGQSKELSLKVFSGFRPEESPLSRELLAVNQELVNADKAAEDLLKRLSELGGINPETATARTSIGNLRGAIAGVDPVAVASQRITQGDVDALQQEIQGLQNYGRELSTIEQLAIKYGEEWSKIDPSVRSSLETLANQRDTLQANVDKTREWNNVLNQAGTTIGGVLQDLITGTNDWRSSLNSALKSLANLVFQQALAGLAGKDGIGVFSFLSGSLGAGTKAFANGGVVNSPTMFRFADGGTMRNGLMGEAGPEAIIPLKRGRDGKLGVAGGSSSTSITVNVDASGSNVQGSDQQASQLGRAIAAAVQQELIKQKRPGGLLTR